MKFKTGFFNPRLWWEGMKRLRVLGFGVAFLAITVSALIPAVTLVNDLTAKYHYYGWTPSIRTLEEDSHCIPLAFLPWLMPIFVLVMFSFLFKRKESDFYHSIPYTRTCIYTTYTAAILTWVWVITALCALVSGILWAVNPYVIFSVGMLIRWIFASGLSATLLCAIMLLAMSLCGNIATTLLNFLVFAALPRTVCFLLGFLLDSGARSLLVDAHSFMGGFFSLKWFLPLSIFEFASIELDTGANFYNTSVYVYTAIVSVLVLIAAGFCYKRRRSETAGNSAPSDRIQHVFRIIFSLPFALIAATMWVDDEYIVASIMIVILLLIYYLYELITTKQIKRLWKATPYLGVLLVCCLVFLGIYQVIRHVVLYWEIEPSEIQAVEFVDPGYGLDRDTNYFFYEDDSLFPLKTEDPTLIGAAADMLKKTQETQRTNFDYYGGKEIKFYLKNGFVITRYVREENAVLRDWFAEHDPTFRKRLLDFPISDEVYCVSMWEWLYRETYPVETIRNERLLFDSEEEKQEEFVCLLEKEYLLLTDEDCYTVRFDSQLENDPRVIPITLRLKSSEGRSNYFVYISPEYLPETYAWLSDYLQERNLG